MSKMIKWLKKTDKFDLVGYLLLIICGIVYWIFLYNNLYYLTDSDQASNLIYAKMLLEEKSVFSTNWYYSTYVDLFNLDKFQAFWFVFFDSWKKVHLLTNISVSILFFFSFYYVCKLFNIKNIPWLSFLAMGSLTYSYYSFVVSFNIYALYMTIGLLSFGLIIDCLKNDNKIKYFLLFIAVFIGSSGGIRNITTIYVPIILLLFLVFFINKTNIKLTKAPDNKIVKKTIAIVSLSSIVGTIFNKMVLCSLTGFESTSLSITRELLKDTINIFKEILINGWLSLFGINDTSIISLICLILIILTIFWIIKLFLTEKGFFYEKFLILYFTLSACIVSATFFVSSAFSFESRYLLQSFVFLIIIVGLVVNSLVANHIKMIIYIILFICVAFRTNLYARQEIVLYDNQEIIDICDRLEKENLTEGYSSFWNGNVLTELSNGKIESWTYLNEAEFSNGLKNNLNDPHDFLYEWLQKKEHFVKYPKNDFYLILDKTYESLFNHEEVDKRCIYNGDSRMLLVIDEFDDLLLLFN